MASTKGAQRSRARPKKKQAKSTSTTKPSNKQATPAPSPLLELAPELRNAIVRYVVVSDEPIKVQSQLSRRKGHHHFTMIPGLTMVCKQLRLESQRIFLEENDFLEGLGEDYLDASFNDCDNIECYHGAKDHYGCALGQDIEWCDVHPGSILC
jgi:hypothetical protein